MLQRETPSHSSQGAADGVEPTLASSRPCFQVHGDGRGSCCLLGRELHILTRGSGSRAKGQDGYDAADYVTVKGSRSRWCREMPQSRFIRERTFAVCYFCVV